MLWRKGAAPPQFDLVVPDTTGVGGSMPEGIRVANGQLRGLGSGCIFGSDWLGQHQGEITIGCGKILFHLKTGRSKQIGHGFPRKFPTYLSANAFA